MKIVALAGGVGGAKLADGLAQILAPEDLAIIVNTGDDFEHFGLYICPDLDTVCYTLAGMVNPDTGWGCIDETWVVMEHISRLGGPDWFRLGDRDLGTHLERSRRLRTGEPLSQITHHFCQSWNIRHSVFPMSDQPVRTYVDTETYGELAFQEYFVHLSCKPRVRGFRFQGIETAKPSPGVLDAIENADAMVICPSNPWVSIDPILKVLALSPDNLPSSLNGKPVVAVSPIIGGKAVRGPAAKMYTELGTQPSALAVSAHYGRLLTGIVVDTVDAHLEEELLSSGIKPLITKSIMKTREDRYQLAEDVLNYIMEL